jgi:hypothetical protein
VRGRDDIEVGVTAACRRRRRWRHVLRRGLDVVISRWRCPVGSERDRLRYQFAVGTAGAASPCRRELGAHRCGGGQGDALAQLRHLLHGAVHEMRDSRCVNDACLVEPETAGLEIVKEADAAAKDHRHHVQDELVEQPGSHCLLHDARAHKLDDLAAGGRSRPLDRLLDTLGDEGVRPRVQRTPGLPHPALHRLPPPRRRAARQPPTAPRLGPGGLTCVSTAGEPMRRSSSVTPTRSTESPTSVSSRTSTQPWSTRHTTSDRPRAPATTRGTVALSDRYQPARSSVRRAKSPLTALGSLSRT